MTGLPTLRMLDGAATARIWLATEPQDMRCGFDRLAERARVVTEQDPLGGHLFVFRSRRGDRLKILMFDRDGWVLWYKRLEAGVFKLPRPGGASSLELRASELAMMLDGIDLASVRRLPRYARKKVPA
ncbi:MAG TPA: IS66 family insertion sequence element accessory protein TnpB [Terriglobales bacterium]|nr:IS66 family insertion sequence element accessory protein TnpB [Terriglobales bacterium]